MFFLFLEHVAPFMQKTRELNLPGLIIYILSTCRPDILCFSVG